MRGARDRRKASTPNRQNRNRKQNLLIAGNVGPLAVARDFSSCHYPAVVL